MGKGKKTPSKKKLGLEKTTLADLGTKGQGAKGGRPQATMACTLNCEAQTGLCFQRTYGCTPQVGGT